MSMRIIASSLPNTASASALLSSVLPTPVGPRKRNDPTGRFGSLTPTRPRRMARATARTASSCPTTRACSVSSSVKSRALSLSLSLVTGMPVQFDTTAAMSSAVTRTAVFSASRACFFRSAAACVRKLSSASRSRAAFS